MAAKKTAEKKQSAYEAGGRIQARVSDFPHGLRVFDGVKLIRITSRDYTLLIMEDGCIRFMGAPEEVLQHSDELLAMGVNCPRATTLTNILREKGYYHGPVCRNVDQAVAACKEVLA